MAQVPKSKRHPWKGIERLHNLQIKPPTPPSTGEKKYGENRDGHQRGEKRQREKEKSKNKAVIFDFKK